MIPVYYAFMLSIACISLRNAVADKKTSRSPPAVIPSSKFQKFIITDNDTSCIDGSHPVYYYHPGYDDGVKKWHVHFEGGGWCMDPEGCYKRSLAGLGSSINYQTCSWTDCSVFGDCNATDSSRIYESHNKASNPYMYNWNAVHIRYCDSSSYAGDATIDYLDHKLMFKGKNNRDAYIRSILDLGMKNATEIILSGCSAGGLGILFGLDDMAQKIKVVNPTTKIRGLADSSFFLDVFGHKYTLSHNHSLKHKEHKHNKELDFSGLMRRVFTTMNLSAGISHDCLNKYQHEIIGFSEIMSPASHCVFPRNLVSFIKTPMFLIQSRYDRWQIRNIYQVNINRQQDTINSRGDRIMREIELKFLSKPQHGAFLSSCYHHCRCYKDDLWNGKTVTSTFEASKGINPASAFWQWYSDGAPDIVSAYEKMTNEAILLPSSKNKHYYGQVAPFPCPDCCRCSID